MGLDDARYGRVLAAGALGAGLWAAAALPAAAADVADPKVTTSGSVTTFSFVSHTENEKFIPKGGTPTTEFPDAMPKAGDSVTFTESLMQSGTKIGSDTGTCTFGGGETISCDVTMTFAKGTLVFASAPVPINNDRPFRVPIASGTGAYAGARGQIYVSHINEDDDNNTVSYTTSPDGPAPQVSAVPAGGAGTGDGSTAGTERPWLFVAGAAAVAAGAGALGAGLRSARRAP